MRRIVVDTDPGVDDTAAIFFLLASGLFQVDALTTVFGNVEVEQCTRNALKILEIAGRTDVPVYSGASRPLARDAHYAKFIHGENGLGDIALGEISTAAAEGGAVDAIISRVMAAPGEITVIALGPLTNVALALATEPRLAQHLQRLIIMGGAVLTWGNITPAASANLYNDPEAARAVYRSGARLVQVGLDVCRPTVITRAHLARMRDAPSRAASFLLQITPFIQEAYRRRGLKAVDDGGVQFNDVLCAAYAVRPALFVTQSLFVEIETQGAFTTGATVADFDGRWGQPPNVEACLGVDALGVADLFTETMMRWRV